MGQDISQRNFTQVELDKFKNHLFQETGILKSWFKNHAFEKSDSTFGVEIESWITNDQYDPSASNDALLKGVNSTSVVPEIAKYNFEINSDPYKLEKYCFTSLEDDLLATWNKCQKEANDLNLKTLNIGIIPTLRRVDLNLDSMSNCDRYYALNNRIIELRKKVPFSLNIKGKDIISLFQENVMLECATTSLQIHLKVDQDEAQKMYNIFQALSAPMVALSANSPYLFGKELWDETRIPLFEQSVETRSHKSSFRMPFSRVSLGSGYVKESLYELFQENLDFPVLLACLMENEREALPHLRLHNGNIWRWNRPIVGLQEGMPHLRIEHRVPPSGPTLRDMVANIAFFIGLSFDFKINEEDPSEWLSFKDCKRNFYNCAKDSLNAEVQWKGTTRNVHDLLLNELLMRAKRGLLLKGIDKRVIHHYLDQTIEARLNQKINGAIWQKRFIQSHGNDFRYLLETYSHNQNKNIPIHQW